MRDSLVAPHLAGGLHGCLGLGATMSPEQAANSVCGRSQWRLCSASHECSNESAASASARALRALFLPPSLLAAAGEVAPAAVAARHPSLILSAWLVSVL